ncbi:MAG: transporter [Geminicoccaceae bacterium]|nr:transporter [Geminicoccaceae bacterium]
MHRRHPISTRPASLCVTATATAVALLHLSSPASAQDATTVSDETLQEELKARDAVIIELMRRVDELERRLGGKDPSPVEAEAAPTEPTEAPRPVESAEAPPPASRGLIDVDELAAERALERTLVDVGALLLPAGQSEIAPAVGFSRRDSNFPALVGGQVANANTERNEFAFDLGLSVGLPFDSQFELNVPFDLVNEQANLNINGGIADSQERTGYGLGDITVGFAKTLLREGEWRPDIVGRVVWDTATGDQFDDGVFLGNGFHQIRGQLVAVKRQDPLAFVGGFTYSYQFEDDDVDLGSEYALSLGAALALSPETSLNVALNQTYSDDIEVNGEKINGSDQLAASFDFGGSAIIAPRTLFRLNTSIGLTDDAPDYTVRATVAYRFNTPFF